MEYRKFGLAGIFEMKERKRKQIPETGGSILTTGKNFTALTAYPSAFF